MWSVVQPLYGPCYMDPVASLGTVFTVFAARFSAASCTTIGSIPVDKVPYRFPTQREPALSAHIHCSRVTVCDGTLIEAISVAARASREAEAPALRSRLRLLPKQRLRLLRRQL